MRRIAAVLVLLLTSGVAWAGLDEDGSVSVTIVGGGCVSLLALAVGLFVLVTTIAERRADIRRDRSRRPTTRTAPPPGN